MTTQEERVPCPCTTFEQDEDCPIGYPSLICGACQGTGVTSIDTVIALAAEMLKVAEQVDELRDPFAAWESIELLKNHSEQRRRLEATIAKADPQYRIIHVGALEDILAGKS